MNFFFKQTAFPILDALDPNGYIMYRLFRDATRYVDGHHVKDLDCLNRDPTKVIVVDWNSKSVESHPRNALRLKEWKGNDDDRSLVDLALLLRSNFSIYYLFLLSLITALFRLKQLLLRKSKMFEKFWISTTNLTTLWTPLGKINENYRYGVDY